MVLAILVDTTLPIRVLRRPAAFALLVVVVSAMAYFFSVAAFLLAAFFFAGAGALWGDSRSIASRKLLLAYDGLYPRNVFLQLANLLQTLGLSHLQLKLHLEQLVGQLALLMVQFDIGQVSNFVYVHC